MHPIEQARAQGRGGGSCRPRHFRRGAREIIPGQRRPFRVFFDCLHDMGDPAGAAAHVRASLVPDGTWMVVEPFAGDDVSRQPESCRTDLLLGVRDVLRAGVAVAGGRAGIWALRPERQLREVIRLVDSRRFRRATRDAVQHGVRSASVGSFTVASGNVAFGWWYESNLRWLQYAA